MSPGLIGVGVRRTLYLSLALLLGCSSRVEVGDPAVDVPASVERIVVTLQGAHSRAKERRMVDATRAWKRAVAQFELEVEPALRKTHNSRDVAAVEYGFGRLHWCWEAQDPCARKALRSLSETLRSSVAPPDETVVVEEPPKKD